LGEGSEAELGVEAVGILCYKVKPAEVLQPGMRRKMLQRDFGESVTAMCFQDVDVAEVSKRGGVGNHADKANLGSIGCVNPETKGIRKGTGNHLTRAAGGPITPVEIGVNRVEIEPRGIVSEMISGVLNFVRHGILDETQGS
jgi:hypothetical protein